MSLRVLVAVALSVFVGQTIKFFLHWRQYGKPNTWIYLEDGGMPSGHAVVLSSLCVAVLYETGFSVLFAVTLVLSVLSLGESMKVKRQPGMQSELMARFVDVRDVLRRKLTEGISHTPEHVSVGIVLGILATVLVYAV